MEKQAKIRVILVKLLFNCGFYFLLQKKKGPYTAFLPGH
jgi:hypothetical protein